MRQRGRESSGQSALFCLASVLAAALSCGPPGPNMALPTPTSPPRGEAPLQADEGPPCVCGTAPGCLPCPSTAESGAAGPTPSPLLEQEREIFPPAALRALHERTAAPTDGQWTRLRAYGFRDDDSPFATTLIHPHPIRAFVVVQVVAVDTSRVDVSLVLGPEEPTGTDLAVEARTGLVATDQLMAIMNGGFKRRHGGFGVALGGAVAAPMLGDVCSFAKTREGGYVIGTHDVISGGLTDAQFIRQTPPCLVERGKRNADLDSEYKVKRWGAAEGGNKEIRRSAVAMVSGSNTLYFAIGDYLTAGWLADAFAVFGDVTAAELDINYSYTRFINYPDRVGGEPVATSPLLRELKSPKREYWKEPSPRDFFALTKRVPR